MPSYDAGVARATYGLDTKQFDQAIQDAIASYGRLRQAQEDALRRVAIPAVQPTQPPAPPPAAPPTSPGLTASMVQQQRALASLEQAQARLARTQGDAARAAQLEGQAQSRLTALITAENKETTQGIAVQRQLASVQQQATRAAQGTSELGRAAQGLNTALGAIGITVGVHALTQFGLDAGRTALELDHTERVTREIAGSTAVYNEILAAARQQQSLFGGSLQENLDGLSGLAVTAKNTGASLQQLIDLQKRLTVLNPAQGATGGLIALNEALAGNVASLSRRFNIPRAALQQLNDTAIPVAERLKVLDNFLNKVGITSAAVSRSVSDTAQTYNTLGAAADSAKVAVGGLLADLFKVPAKVATEILVDVKRTVSGEDIKEEAARALKAANSYDQYTAAIRRRNEEAAKKDPVGAAVGFGQINALTRAQFDYIQALRGTGVSVEDATEKAQQYGAVIQATTEANANYGRILGVSGKATTVFGQSTKDAIARIVALHDSSDAAGQAIDNLTLAKNSGQISAETYATAIAKVQQQQDAAAQAAAEESREQRLLSGAHLETGHAAEEAARQEAAAIEKTIADGAAKDALAAKTELAAFQTSQAADAFIRLNPGMDATTASSAALAAGLNPTIAKLIELKIQADEANNALAALRQESVRRSVTPLGRKDIDSFGLPTPEQTRAAQDFIANQNQASEQARQEALATRRQQTENVETEIRLAAAKGDTARQIALLRQEQSKLVVGSNEYKNVEARIIDLERERKKGGGAGGKGLSTLTRTDIELAGDYQAQLDAVNAQLARGNLTQVQRNQLLIKQQDLEEKISNEKEKQADASRRAALDIVHDAQKRLEEAREEAAARRAIANASTSQEQKQAAALKLQEISLEQQQRAADIAKETKEAGGTVATTPTGTPVPRPPVGGVPIPVGVPQLPGGVPIPFVPPSAIAAPPPVTVNLSITVTADGRIIQQRADPGVVLNLLRGAFGPAGSAGGP